jgi:hypothetical protein
VPVPFDRGRWQRCFVPKVRKCQHFNINMGFCLALILHTRRKNTGCRSHPHPQSRRIYTSGPTRVHGFAITVTPSPSLGHDSRWCPGYTPSLRRRSRTATRSPRRRSGPPRRYVLPRQNAAHASNAIMQTCRSARAFTFLPCPSAASIG